MVNKTSCRVKTFAGPSGTYNFGYLRSFILGIFPVHLELTSGEEIRQYKSENQISGEIQYTIEKSDIVK